MKEYLTNSEVRRRGLPIGIRHHRDYCSCYLNVDAHRTGGGEWILGYDCESITPPLLNANTSEVLYTDGRKIRTRSYFADKLLRNPIFDLSEIDFDLYLNNYIYELGFRKIGEDK